MKRTARDSAPDRNLRPLDEEWIATAARDDVAASLDAGASVHPRDDRWRNRFASAPEHRNEAVVALLLDRGTDPNATDDNERTALPPRRGPPDADLLLRAGTVPDRADARGRTALHAAVENGGLAVIGFLLDRGADPDMGRETALYAASVSSRHRGASPPGSLPLRSAESWARWPRAHATTPPACAPPAPDQSSAADTPPNTASLCLPSWTPSSQEVRCAQNRSNSKRVVAAP